MRRNESLVAGRRALELFTDRYVLCRQFAGWLNDEESPESVQVLCGPGGNGKSLLVSHLRDRLCRMIPPDIWSYLRELPSEECVNQLIDAQEVIDVPVGYIDFARHPRDGWNCLMKLRRDLSNGGLRTPMFDFAAVVLVERHRWSSERIDDLFAADDLKWAMDLAKLLPLPGVSIFMPFMELAQSRLGGRFAQWRAPRLG